MNTRFFVNRIIQRGIYYFELSQESKTRPYLVISRDDAGYGSEILAFSITERFAKKEVNLPVVINGGVSFIRVSAALEVPKKKIIKSSFDGLLREDIFNIALRMYTKRFQDIDSKKLEVDLNSYLDELTNIHIPLYVNNKVLFDKEKYLNDDLNTQDNQNAKIVYEKKKLNLQKREDDPIVIQILHRFTINILIKFKNDMKMKRDNELKIMFSLTDEELKYMKENIRSLIKRKEKIRQIERKESNARNSKI